MVLTGMLSGVAHYLPIETFVLAVVVVVAPFRYSALVWGVLIGFLIWDGLPTELDWLGIFLIVGVSIYIMHRVAKPKRFGERLVLRL